MLAFQCRAAEKDGDDEIDGLTPLGNRLYRYQLEDGKLSNPKLLIDLPVNPGPRHTGGEVAVGPDNNIYITVGDMDGTFKKAIVVGEVGALTTMSTFSVGSLI